MYSDDYYLKTHEKRFQNTLDFIDAYSLIKDGDKILSLGDPSLFDKVLKGKFKDLTIDETTCDLRHKFPIEDDQYDVVLCLEVIEHIKDQETTEEYPLSVFTGSGIISLMNESARVLKPEGALIITTPNLHCYKTLYNWTRYEDLRTYAPHPRELSETYLKDKLKTRFKNIETDYYTSWGCHGTPKDFMDKMETFLERCGISTNYRREDNLFVVARQPKPKLHGDIEHIHDRNDVLNNAILQDRRDLSDYFCHHPFDNFEPRSDGNVAVCCIAWLPKFIGNLNNNTFDEIYNSEDAQKIRQSILDGTFEYCDHRICPRIINNGLLKKDEVTMPRHRDIIDNNKVVMNYPKFINFCNDESCNMACPSCRISKINFYKGKQYEQRLDNHNKIVDAILEKDIQEPVLFSVTGSGDPFGSKVFRDFLLNFDGEAHPNIMINLQTNGVMLTPKTWRQMSKIHNNLSSLLISFDAATKETYDIVRVGGNWDVLVNNVKFLCEPEQRKYIDYLRLDFVVQDWNYKEMPAFVRLAKTFGGIDCVEFSMITNWGTFTDEEFNKRAIWMDTHPDFHCFMDVLRDEDLADDIVVWGNMAEYYKRANS